MNKLEQLLIKQQNIALEIEEEKNKSRNEALATVRSLCKQYSITISEIKKYVLERKPRTSKGGVSLSKKIAAKKSLNKNEFRRP